MRSGILTVLVFIIFGVIIANVLANPEGTRVVANTLTDWWRTSINGMLGRPSVVS